MHLLLHWQQWAIKEKLPQSLYYNATFKYLSIKLNVKYTLNIVDPEGNQLEHRFSKWKVVC